VSVIQGQQDNQADLHRLFKGVWGAWVNTDGFTIGEKNETFYGIRAYEIARHQGVEHYVYAATDYAVKDCDWDENYHWGHNDAKGRVADFILAQKQSPTKASVITTGPYMNMLFDGMFVSCCVCGAAGRKRFVNRRQTGSARGRRCVCLEEPS
jgi:hypothetical protein